MVRRADHLSGVVEQASVRVWVWVWVCVWVVFAWRSANILVFRNLCSEGRPKGKFLQIGRASCRHSGSVSWFALRIINQTREAHKPAKPTNSWGASRTMIQLDGPQSGPSFWGSGTGFRTGVGLGVGVGLCLGSICLAVCQYSGVSEFVLRGKTEGQILTVDRRSLLSFSLCLMVRSAHVQPS